MRARPTNVGPVTSTVLPREVSAPLAGSMRIGWTKISAPVAPQAGRTVVCERAGGGVERVLRDDVRAE